MLDEVRSQQQARGQLKSERLREALVETIRGLPQGATLPTERELCVAHGVSRATVRAVLQQLESEQRIYRRQGKGTFVARAKLEQRLGLTSHTEEMRASGIKPGSKLINVTRVPAGAEVAAALRLPASAEVLQIERLRLADQEPIALEVLYLNAERFDGISASLGEDVSFYQLLHSDYGVELASAEETIEAVVAGPREAKLLNCGPAAALLLLSRRTLDTRGRPIEYVRSLYRGDRFRFRQRLERHAEQFPAPALTPALRPAVGDDAAALARVFVAAWRSTYVNVVDAEVLAALDEQQRTAWFAVLLADSALQTVVAEGSDREVIGFVRFGADPESAEGGHIFGLYVHPNEARRGVGRQLLEHALARLAAEGRSVTTLWVFEANEGARGFYAAAGFVATGRERVEEEFGAPEVMLRRSSPESASQPTGRERGADTGVLVRLRRLGAPSPVRVESELAPRAGAPLAAARAELVDELSRTLDSGYPPGASLLVVDADGPLLRINGGFSCVIDAEIATTSETIYDLASLTKVIATVPLALVLDERRAWSLDDPVARWLPGFPRADLSLRQLLTHTSGLPPHRPFYRRGSGVSAIRPALFAEAVAAGPGPVNYSDLNYILLGWALSRCAATPLARLFTETVARPLGMQQTRYRPPLRERRRIAATELDGDQRLAPGLVWGEVHDGNAWALGGVAGHAGLFAPASDLGRFASALLRPDHHPVLGSAAIAEMTRRQAGAPPDVRALGWRLDASDWGHWPQGSYWHTGFTGTSLLIAPEFGVGVVLLFGGVHPVRRPEEQAALRRALHRRLAEAWA